ncbi:integral membrane protein [Diaporthe helianthi]|uniref:Integral membrane protein n=1 Tax=Diaporthe helianthi TaxID=158607 RepID=A0A2P5I0G5_DIAHE|nr:integral membrane protein [Diaporthe helianthi]
MCLGENSLGQTCRGAPLFLESQATFLKALAIVAMVLAVPSIGLRWYARCKSSTLGVDDYLALLATIALIAVSAVQLASSFIGFGVHVWVVDPRMAIPLLRLYWVSQQLYILDQLLTKISLLALYLRVFPTRWINITARYGILVMVIQETIFYFLILLRCAPVSASWDIQHFGILVMPLPDVIRIRYVRKFAPTADLSWDIAPAISWSLIELLSTVICLNLPPCRHLISKLIPRRLATTTIHKGQNGTGAYGAFSQHGAQTIELTSKSPPMGGILHTTTIEVTHERNLSDDELLMVQTRPSVSSAASRRSL